MKNLVKFIIITFILVLAVNGYSTDTKKPMATGNAYLDTATGHKYIKSANGTYTEYTRKGELFKKDVPATQPHLASSKYIKAVSEESVLLYKKYKDNKPVFTALKMSAPQPEGTRVDQLLVSIKQLLKHGTSLNGLAIGESVSYQGTQPKATAKAYLDLATGHRYIKNADDTYTEFTRKGDVFKTNVPNTQPHLASSKYITQIEEDSFLVYTQYKNYKPVVKILPSSASHPEKWKCKKEVLVSMKNPVEKTTVKDGLANLK